MFSWPQFNFSFQAKIETELPKVKPTRQNKSFTINDSGWKDFLSSHWKRLLIGVIVGLLLLILLSFVGRTVFAIFFTILPLFFGYGLSFLLQPLIHFFDNLIGHKLSKIFVFSIFVIVVFCLVIGLLFLLIFQLDDLYQQFLQGSGSKDFKTNFLSKVRNNQITDLKFNKIPNQPSFKLTFLDNDKPVEIITKIKGTADIYIFFLKMISIAPFLQRLLFSGIAWIYSSIDNYEWLNTIFKNVWFWMSCFYLIFFTLIVAAFTLDDRGAFFSKIWNFFTKEQDPKTTELLKIELKKIFSSWFKALLLVQTYILFCTTLFIFIAGISFMKWSTYHKSIFILAFFMFLCNFVPYIGPTIGFIPIIGVGVIDAIKQGGDQLTHWLPLIIATGGCLLVQIGESAFVSPLVYSHKIKIKPITIIFGISLFGVIFGVMSMPFAIPIIILIKTIAKIVYKKKWNI